MSGSFYALTGPTRWAGPPEQFSYSSLRVLEECPLRWQLMQSEYGELPRCPERPRAAALVGRLAHEMLEQILRAMARAGYPASGGEEFRRVVAEVGLMARIRAGLLAARERLRTHPRAAGERLDVSERDVYNRVCQLFQGVYGSLSQARRSVGLRAAATSGGPGERGLVELLASRGVLTELHLTHGELPLRGVLDLVLWDEGQAGVVDFKTGEPASGHREQVEIYALLWWRATGMIPAWIEVRYPGKVQRDAVDAASLAALERQLRSRLAELGRVLQQAPAPARPGPNCRHCEARAFCDSYWRQQVAPTQRPVAETWIDVELTVVEVQSGTGFVGVDGGGGRLNVVFPEELGQRFGPFEAGQRLRVLGASYEGETQVLQLRQATEVFRMAK